VFVGVVSLATWTVARFARTLASNVTRALLAATSILFAAAAGLTFVLPTTAPGLGRVLVVVILVAAMGLQNALHRLTPALGAMTTVMTGNVTQWFVELVRPLPDNTRKHRLLGGVIAAFAVGCVAGALGVARFGFVVMVLPMAAALFARSRVRQNL